MTAWASWFGPALVERIGWSLVHSVWEVAAVAVVAAGVLRLLHRSPAHARYLAACGAMGAMAILPLVTFGLLGISSSAWLKSSVSRSASDPIPVALRDTQSIGVGDPRNQSPAGEVNGVLGRNGAARPLGGSPLEPVLPWLVGAWGVGVFGLSVRLLGGWLWIQWLVRRGTQPVARRWVESLARLKDRLRIDRPVHLFESTRLQVPLVVGWLRPVILLPVTALTGLPSDQLEAILAHELAHVGRYDYLVNLVQSVVETLLFYHPAAWWISGRIRAEREHCCDDRAVEICGDRLIYARALATLEEQRSGGWLLAPSARDGSLLDRVRRLLGVSSPVERPAGGLAGTLALVTVSFLGLALFVAPGTSTVKADVETRKVITGVVVDSEGSPVALADLWLSVSVYPPQINAIVLGTARTGDSGQFRIVEQVPAVRIESSGAKRLWGHKTGFQVASVVLADDRHSTGVDPKKPIRLSLSPTVSVSCSILDAEGRSAAGAKVTVSVLRGGGSLPEELAARLAERTDKDGRVTLNIAPPDSIGLVRVTSEQSGIQDIQVGQDFRSGARFRLRPAVPIVGRITGGEPRFARNRSVNITTDYNEHSLYSVSGRAEVMTDDQGRFSIPAVARGRVSAWVVFAEDSLYQAAPVEQPGDVNAKRIEIEIPLKRMTRVRGVVRDKGTGKPLEGSSIRFGSSEVVGALPVARTNAQGRYEVIAPPGPKSYCYVIEVPKGYLQLARGFEVLIGTSDGQTLPPIELERGVTLGGVVVDADGKPVASAEVEGKWQKFYPANSPDHPGMSFGSTFTATAKTDAHGQFLLEGIHPGANVMLEASAEEARTDRPTQSAAGATTPAKLVISGANTVALFGRVVDADDRPVSGALVRIRSRPLKDDGHPEPGPIRFAEGEVRTDGDGRFRTPRQIKRGYGYRAEVKPVDETFMPESSPWLAIKNETRPFFPKMGLRRLRTVRGRIVDSQGKPVAGASVRQAGDGPAPTHDVTDSEGRFALPGVVAGPAFVFVAKDGYRFEGKPIKTSAAVVDVTLTRASESFPKPSMSLPPLLTRADELTILHRVFDGYAERVIKEGGSGELFGILRVLRWLDPARAIELLFDKRLEPWQPNNIRLDLAARMVRESYDEARELIEAIQDANMRSYAYSEASAALPDSERVRKLELLNESLLAGRAVVDPEARVLRLADIGGRLFDLGKTEEATNLVREGQETAVKLRAMGTSAWARGRLAEELAQVDLPAALNLLEGTEAERDHDQYLGHIAHELAGRNPAEAERVLMMMRDVWPNFRDNYTQRVCYRMVIVDPQRVMALAAGMKTFRHRARALGAMALALEKTKGDHGTAVRLLGEAFEVLDQAVASGKDDWDGLGMACTAAAGLLPIVEQVDARLLPEYLWRTLALRPPIPGPKGRESISDIANAGIAAMATRYDRAVGRQVFDGFAGRALALRIGLDDWGFMFKGESVFEAAAVVDPARAAAMIDSLPEPSGLSTQELKNAARLSVARILARPGDERWRDVERNLLHLWPIDSEED